MGKPAVHAVQRGKIGNKIDTGLYVQIREFNYDGARRWGAADHRAHTKQVSNEEPTDQDRELDVVRAIEEAWGFGILMEKETPKFVLPPNPFPNPGPGEKIIIHLDKVDPGPQYSYEVMQTQYYLPKTTAGYRPPIDYPVVNKWIYIFVGDVGGAQLEAEIYASDANKWYVRRKPSGPRSARIFTATQEDAAKGISVTTPFYRVKAGELYQFFLSPLQLNKHALSELLSHVNQNPSSAPANSSPATAEQLANVTIRRRYQPKTGVPGERRQEIVDLLDPFAWAEQVTFCDFQPVLMAQLKLATNRNELAKQFISGVLAGMIETDDKKAKKDPLKLVGHMRMSAQPLDSPAERNAATQWLDRYKKCMAFLEGEIGNACGRAIQWMDSEAHRIVEIACQEELTAPMPGLEVSSPLTYGMVHYINILRTLIASPIGQDFLARLYKKEKNRIPYHNVIAPADKGSLRPVREDVGGDLLLTLLTLFAPLIIRFAGAGSETKELVAHLKKIEVESEVVKSQTLGFSFISSLKDAGVKTLKLDKVQSLTSRLFPSNYKNPCSDLIELLKMRGEQIAGLYSLLTGLKVYGEKASDDQLKRFGQLKEKCEYPKKVLSFILNQGQKSLASYVEERFGVDLEKWVKNESYYMASEEVEKFIQAGGIEDFEGITKYYEWMEGLGKILEGPVEFVFGAWGLIVQGGEVKDAWEQGDFGAAAGKAIQWGGALVASVQGVTAMYAMAIGAEVEGGPLGWIAAVLTLIGMLVVWGFSENEIEKYVEHCFLGKRYGADDGKASWTERMTFRSLASGDDRFLKQQKCLVNMLGAFKMWLAPTTFGIYQGIHFGGFVRPGYVPPGAKVEVLFTVRAADTTERQTDFGTIVVIELDSGHFVVPEGQGTVEKVEVHAWRATAFGHDDSVWGKEQFGFFSISFTPKLPPGFKHVSNDSHPNRFTLNVRLDVNGKGMYIPAEKKETSNDSKEAEKTESHGIPEGKYLSLDNWNDVGFHHMWVCSDVKSTLEE